MKASQIVPDPLNLPANPPAFLRQAALFNHIFIELRYLTAAFKKFEEKPADQFRRESFAKLFMWLTMLMTIAWTVTSLISLYITINSVREWVDFASTATGWGSVFTSIIYYFLNTGSNGISINAACMTFRISAQESLRYNRLLEQLEKLHTELFLLKENNRALELLLQHLISLIQKLSNRQKTTIFTAMEAFATIELLTLNAYDFLNKQNQMSATWFTHQDAHHTNQHSPAIPLNEYQPLFTQS